MVIFSHSFPLSQGVARKDPFVIFSGNQETFGGVGVGIFFIISGFLISQSYDRSRDIKIFLRSRILRIFPALALVLIITTLVFGPLTTTLSINNYFSNPSTYLYLKNIFLHPIQFNLPGVFSHNIYPQAVNGNIWTLESEFIFYLIIALLGLTGLIKKTSILIITLISYFVSFFFFAPTDFEVKLWRYFITGTLFYVFREDIPLNRTLALTSLLIILLSVLFGRFTEIFPFFGGYFLLYFAFSLKINLSWFSKYGDFSYGLYLFAFPIQQIIVSYHGGSMFPLINFFIAFPITLLFAAFSWYTVEKHTLMLKKHPIQLFGRNL